MTATSALGADGGQQQRKLVFWGAFWLARPRKNIKNIFQNFSKQF
jgi:hypothetical protein